MARAEAVALGISANHASQAQMLDNAHPGVKKKRETKEEKNPAGTNTQSLASQWLFRSLTRPIWLPFTDTHSNFHLLVVAVVKPFATVDYLSNKHGEPFM